ncbi:MAG TPA: NADH-quinone oxidoreductase subunit J [Jiangellaceae bacterium]
MNGVEITFVLFGGLAVVAGAFAVTTSRVVHAALWLAVSLAAIAGCFLMLAAEVLVWVQILIYVGAVVVLVLFALMLTRAPGEPSPAAPAGRIALDGIIAGMITILLLAVQLSTFGDERIELGGTGGSAEDIGGGLFSNWVVPFEALSVLLLAALVGAIALTRRGGGDEVTGGSRSVPSPEGEGS